MLDFRYYAFCLITIDRLHVPIFVPMSTIKLLYFDVFSFPFSNNLCGRSRFRLCCHTPIPHNKFRCKIASFLFDIFAQAILYMVFFCLYYSMLLRLFMFYRQRLGRIYGFVCLRVRELLRISFYLKRTYALPTFHHVYIYMFIMCGDDDDVLHDRCLIWRRDAGV